MREFAVPETLHCLDAVAFQALVGTWRRKGRRRATEIFLHISNPGIGEAPELPAAGVSRIVAEHASVLADGTFRTGRHWDAPPGSSPGTGGNLEAGPFLLDITGDFGEGRDRFEGPQREAALGAIALIQDLFDLPVDAMSLHDIVGTSQRWPNSGISQAELLNEVRARRGAPRPRPARHSKDGALAAARAWLRGPADMNSDDLDNQAAPTLGSGPSVAPFGSTRAARLDPGTLAALRPYVIDLWGGSLSSGGVFKTDEGDIARIFDEDIPRRIAALPRDKTLPIVVYAHGGLVSEEAGLQIAANQVPWWIGNGCYPLQFIWETGFFEEIERLFGVQRAATRDLSDFKDAVVEAAVRAGGGPRIWGGMKDAAAAAFAAEAAGSKVAERLVALASANPKIRLHAVGHSAGSIFHAHLLRRLDALDAPPLESLTFMAPAITVADYERLADPLVPKRVKRVRIFTMSKDFELDDTVTWAYGKSLLYLIHNALEPKSGEPILGLEESLRTDPRLVKRFGLGGAASQTGSVVWSQTPVTTGSYASRATSHGGFDNDVSTMESIARGILGIPDATPLPQPFPPDTETRAARHPRPPARPALLEEKPMPAIQTAGGGSRKALCIGINAYPNPANRLRGCVGDAMDWEAALVRLGFSVDSLHDGEATRTAILHKLSDLVVSSRSGDVLIVQYSGHGTHVPDLDGDEVSGQDQAICPVDFEEGQLLIDDDIRAVLQRLPTGVQLTCFMDNCYSYSNTRMAVGKVASAGPDSLKRFVELTPEIVERYRNLREGARAVAPVGPGTPEAMTWVAFAACNSDEVAYETSGRGDFSRLAVPLLSAGLTNRQFRDRVIDGLGAQPRQHPMLDCRRDFGNAPLLTYAGRGRDPVPQPQIVQGSADKTIALADLFDAMSRLLR